VYLLDMGESVSIRELAEQMIRFYGYEPGTDIAITYTGLRTGEKLLEKLHADTETPEPTGHARILKLQRKTLINGRIVPVLERLKPICFHDPHQPSLFRSRHALRAVLQEVIPGIGPAGDGPERATGRGTADDPDTVQGRPVVDVPDEPKLEPWMAAPVTDKQLQELHIRLQDTA